jgi:hypothetical protein
MSQHTGRVKPGMSHFGKPSNPGRSSARKSSLDVGGPNPMLVDGKAMTKQAIGKKPKMR